MVTLIVALTSFALVTTLDSARAEAAVEPDQAVCPAVVSRATIVRKGPGTKYAVTARAPAKAPVVVYGKDLSSKWTLVDVKTKSGYVAGWVPVRSVTVPKRCK